MNKVILMGRLTRDPEVRYSTGENSLAIARFSIAVDRRFRRGQDGAEADFFNCTAFGKQGEFVEKYLKKGTKVLLSGRIQNDNYTNRDGQKVSSVQIIAEEIEFAESKNSSGRNEGNSEFQGRPSAPVSEGFMNLPDSGDDEGIPFTF
ncbi:MAG: single-stranded DNA-binding protein [Lachnospiraceae bacterium]|nr:single-stranded DNA-binding protein [Lachnospiraceae bacterium]